MGPKVLESLDAGKLSPAIQQWPSGTYTTKQSATNSAGSEAQVWSESESYLDHGLLARLPRRPREDIVARHADDALDADVVALDGDAVHDEVADADAAAEATAHVGAEPLAKDGEAGEHGGALGGEGAEEVGHDEVRADEHFEDAEGDAEAMAGGHCGGCGWAMGYKVTVDIIINVYSVCVAEKESWFPLACVLNMRCRNRGCSLAGVIARA